MKPKLFVTLSLVLMLVSAVGFAGTACTAGASSGPTVVPADGRIVDFDFVAPSGNNFYQANLTKGHSYSIEVRQDYDDALTTNNFVTSVYDSVNGATCSSPLAVNAAAGSAVAGVRDTSAMDPVLPLNSFRGSVIATASGTYKIQVHNNDATNGHYVSVSVSETTEFSPALSTFSGFATFYSFVNTTGQTVKGTVTALDPTGVALGAPFALTVNANGNVSTNTTAMGVPANKSGYAILAHDGPGASLNSVSIIANFTTNFVETIDFKPVREHK